MPDPRDTSDAPQALADAIRRGEPVAIRLPGGRTQEVDPAEFLDAEEVDLDTEEVFVNGRRFTNADAERLADEVEAHEPKPRADPV
ncbi:hypothetical protein [Kineococcus rhizosphaerae]|uniref:Uncharacterized protein n=1 Tax=Kineococcus rhizosphaerae TaxID=559628 RepID=A0A2T0QNG7_9ACTN|nr:hypothetical protein [Kineococcus rhizosphaerae]PRY06096.1 hypothetical protein CLV37_13511 [Kineococcus rhizosphaerae]